MRLTGLYNPRIYIASDIAKSNTDMTDEWVKMRVKDHSDEISSFLAKWFKTLIKNTEENKEILYKLEKITTV